MGTGSRARRCGFTLIELLVAIGILGLLIAITMPAVQAAREASRRSACTNNLRQLGIAVQNYEVSHGRLPRAGTAGETLKSFQKLHLGRKHSWAVLLLPYLEERQLYAEFDVSQPATSLATNPQARQIEVLLCKSDDSQDRQFEDSDCPRCVGTFYGKGNYAAFVSPPNKDSKWNGALDEDGRRLAEATDGSSRCLLMSEVRTRAHTHDPRGAWAVPWPGSSLLTVDFFASTDQIAAETAQTPNSGYPDILFECPEAEAAQQEGVPCQPWQSPGGVVAVAPRSRHVGGVNVVYLDGHVGFLSDDTDAVTMASLVHVNDGNFLR